MNSCNIKWCGIMFPTFEQRLKRATQCFINTLSDRTVESSESAYKGFAELLGTDFELGTLFKCSVVLVENDLAIIHDSARLTHSELDLWLYNVDKFAAENLPEYKFTGFSGGKWVSGDIKGFQIEANFTLKK